MPASYVCEQRLIVPVHRTSISHRLAVMPRRLFTLRRYMLLTISVLIFCALGVTGTTAHQSRTARQGAAATPHSTNEEASQTAAAIASTSAPARNLLDLARRLHLHQLAPIDPYVGTGPHDDQVGSITSFYVAYASSGYFSMNARLLLKTAHAYWYVDAKLHPDMTKLAQSAQLFETSIYPTDHANFGTEWTPGIDRDPRLTVLVGPLPGAGGYFSAEDLYPRSISPYSNQRKMLYVDSSAYAPGSAAFGEVLAHELQHMIEWHMHPRQDAWINEGSSMLAQKLNGYTADGFDQAFTQMPNTQLNNFTLDDLNIDHYGAGFLWMLYFYQHYGGQKALRTLMADRTKTGMPLFDEALGQLGSKDTSTDMFRNWVVANYLDNPTINGGVYGYNKWPVQAAVTPTIMSYPMVLTGTVAQYATNYVSLTVPAGSTAPLKISFKANETVPLLTAPTRANQWLWWGNKGDMMDSTLTRALDLSHVHHATLNYTLWYDTEQDFDYAYVEVSTDGGGIWHSLPGQHSTNANPNGSNEGNGYTGRSSAVKGGPSTGWLPESVDLSHYTGHKILIRFEYVTDDEFNVQGLALGNVSVPEIGYSDNAASLNGWTANGWIRVQNVLPETWLVQAIITGQDGPRVQEMPVQAGTGVLTLPTTGVSRVVLAISPVAPQTTISGNYELSVSP